MNLVLSPRIYPAECVVETAEAYAGVCSVSFTAAAGEGEHLVEITPLSELIDGAQLAHEFLNYLLDLSAERHMERE